MTTILIIKLTHRLDNALKFQDVLTKFSCNIKTRIGLHDNSCGVCSPFGIIILEVFGSEQELSSMFDNLNSIAGANMRVVEI